MRPSPVYSVTFFIDSDCFPLSSIRSSMAKFTFYSWYRGANPLGWRAGRVAKLPQLLYVLGALLGDGCPYLWRSRYQVWLVGEEDFSAKYAEKISTVIGRQVKHYKYGKKNAWFVEVQNAELYFLLREARRDPSILERLVEQAGMGRGWLELVDGFFDAEGCVKVTKERVRKTPKICLDACNADLPLIEAVRSATTKSLGIQSHLSTPESESPE